jgi:hypothetical protein
MIVYTVCLGTTFEVLEQLQASYICVAPVRISLPRVRVGMGGNIAGAAGRD